VPPARLFPDAGAAPAASTGTTGAGTTGAGAALTGTTGPATAGAGAAGAGTTGAGVAGAAGRPRTASASAASASARCSACGRDTSRARIAALVVTFIAAMRPLSQARFLVGQPRRGPGKVEPMPGDEPGRTLWRHRNFLLLWSGQTVSETGSAVTQLALPLTAVVVLHASTFQVSWLAGWWVFFSPLRKMRDVPEEGPEVGTEEGLEVDRAPGSGIPG
jgi:hypothetical protein